MAYGSLLMVMAIYKAVKSRANLKGEKNNLMQVIVQDQLIYFLVYVLYPHSLSLILTARNLRFYEGSSYAQLST